MENHQEEKRAGGSRLEQKKTTPKKSKKVKKPGRLTGRQKGLVAVVAVLAILLCGALLWRSIFVRPDLDNKKPGSSTTVADVDGDGQPDEIDYGDGVRPRAEGQRKSEDYYTVLILGRDTGGGGNTDTMLLASYDVTNQKATVMSIPRDTMVNVPWDVKRINSVYNYYGGGEKGIQHLYKEIAQLVGFEPDYQVVVEWDGVGEIVNAMGGVYFDVPRDMNYDDPTQDLHIHQKKGYRLLNGDDAMQVIRYRHDNRKNGVMLGYPDGDLGRIKTQQAFLTAMLEQLLKWKNLTNISEFITVFEKNVETDLTYQNIFWFAQKAALGGLSMDSVKFVTMPNRDVSVYSPSVSRLVGYNSWQSYVVPNARELLELVNNDLSPFVEKFTMSDLDIMSKNSDGSISSSTGYVEDKKAARPPELVFSEEPEEPEYTLDENGNPIDPVTGLPLPIDPVTGEPILPGEADPDAPTVPGVTDPVTPGGTTDPGTVPPDTAPPGTTPPGTTDPGTVTPPDPVTPNPPDPGTANPPDSGVTDPGAADPGVPSGGDPGLPAEPGTPNDPGTSLIEPPPEG